MDDFLLVATVVRDDVKLKEQVDDVNKIVRLATDADEKKYIELQKKAKTHIPTIKKKSLELGLMMKIVDAEFSLDNSKIMIVFSSEERVDFRQLLKDLATLLKNRIKLKQVGQRDEVKMMGGVGPCGEPCCCARFLKNFEHVTVKMEKVQGLSLSPTKINGVCGRLMCCLGYESEMYEQILAKMPKVNSEVVGPNGKGTVVYNDILRERVSVKRQTESDSIVIEDFDLCEIEGYGDKSKKEEKKQEKPQRDNQNNKPFKKDNRDRKENQKPETKGEPEVMELGVKDDSKKNNHHRNNHKKNFHKNNKNRT
jgi:cell fate regulator YaaT (PSP1 superfamily)